MVSISKVRAVLFGTLYHWFVASERQLTRPYPSFAHQRLITNRSNKTLYDDISLIPLPADYQPTVEQLPVTGTERDIDGKVTMHSQLHL